jgi:HEAT repeat protein
MRSILAVMVVILACSDGIRAQTRESSLDDLIGVVNGKNSIKSAKAIAAIGKRKPTSDLAIQTLVDSLADDRPAVYIPDYVPITFPVETVGSTASHALAEIGTPAVSRICEFLANDRNKKDVRKLAIRSLSKMECDAVDALPTLQRLLSDPEMEIRFEAVAAIVSVQKNPDALSSVLGTVLSDKSPDVRAAAVRALGGLGEPGAGHVPSLVKLLDDSDDRWHSFTPDMVGTRPVRSDSAMALAEMGDDARVALAKLRTMMNSDSDSLVRVAAAYAIARLDNAAKDAMEYLIAAVQDQEGGYAVPEAAAEALGKLGPKAKSALPVLVDALRHPETMVRIHVVEAIASISPESAESRLLNMLDDADALVRASAIESLGPLRNASPQLLRSYITALDDSDPIVGTRVRRAAAVALGKLQERAAPALPRLKQLVREEDSEWVKDAAVEAIRQISQGRPESDRTKR